MHLLDARRRCRRHDQRELGLCSGRSAACRATAEQHRRAEEVPSCLRPGLDHVGQVPEQLLVAELDIRGGRGRDQQAGVDRLGAGAEPQRDGRCGRRRDILGRVVEGPLLILPSLPRRVLPAADSSAFRQSCFFAREHALSVLACGSPEPDAIL